MENGVSHGPPLPAPCLLLSWKVGRGPRSGRESTAQWWGAPEHGRALLWALPGRTAQRSRGRVTGSGQSLARVRPSGLMHGFGPRIPADPSHSSNIFPQGDPGRAAALPADGRADPDQDLAHPGLFSAWVAYTSPSVTSWIRSPPR